MRAEHRVVHAIRHQCDRGEIDVIGLIFKSIGYCDGMNVNF